jgi:hypothetical protein
VPECWTANRARLEQDSCYQISRATVKHFLVVARLPRHFSAAGVRFMRLGKSFPRDWHAIGAYNHGFSGIALTRRRQFVDCGNCPVRSAFR